MKRNMPAVLLAALLALPAVGQPQGVEASGKVVRLELAHGQVTIAHGPVASMGLPAKQTSFKAKHPKMLEKLRHGSNVTFTFTRSGRDYVITEIECSDCRAPK